MKIFFQLIVCLDVKEIDALLKRLIILAITSKILPRDITPLHREPNLCNYESVGSKLTNIQNSCGQNVKPNKCRDETCQYIVGACGV